jgi:hypothetical protein
MDSTLVPRYAAVGVDRLVLRPQPTLDAAGLERFVADTARSLGMPSR